MIQGKTALELGGIAARGASLEVNGAAYTALELGGVAARLTNGSTLKVMNSNGFSALELGGIAARKPGQVIFA